MSLLLFTVQDRRPTSLSEPFAQTDPCIISLPPTTTQATALQLGSSPPPNPTTPTNSFPTPAATTTAMCSPGSVIHNFVSGCASLAPAFSPSRYKTTHVKRHGGRVARQSGVKPTAIIPPPKQVAPAPLSAQPIKSSPLKPGFLLPHPSCSSNCTTAMPATLAPSSLIPPSTSAAISTKLSSQPKCCPPQHLSLQQPNSRRMFSICLQTQSALSPLSSEFLSMLTQQQQPLSESPCNFSSHSDPIQELLHSSSAQPGVPQPLNPQPTHDHDPEPTAAPSVNSSPTRLPPSKPRMFRSSNNTKLLMPFFMLTLLLCVPFGQAMNPGAGHTAGNSDLSAVGTLAAAAMTSVTLAFQIPLPGGNITPAGNPSHPPPPHSPSPGAAPSVSPLPPSSAIPNPHPFAVAPAPTQSRKRPPQNPTPTPTPTPSRPLHHSAAPITPPPPHVAASPASTPNSASAARVNSSSSDVQRRYAVDTPFERLAIVFQPHDPASQALRKCDKCPAHVRSTTYNSFHQYKNGNCPQLAHTPTSADQAGPSDQLSGLRRRVRPHVGEHIFRFFTYAAGY